MKPSLVLQGLAICTAFVPIVGLGRNSPACCPQHSSAAKNGQEWVVFASVTGYPELPWGDREHFNARYKKAFGDAAPYVKIGSGNRWTMGVLAQRSRVKLAAELLVKAARKYHYCVYFAEVPGLPRDVTPADIGIKQ